MARTVRAATGRTMEVSAELLGQADDDALRATQEAEPVDVLVLRDLADEFGTVAAQAGNDVVDVVDGEHDAADAQRVRGCACRLGSDRRRRVELRQLNPAVAVRGPHHGDVGTDVVEPDDAVHQTPLDRRLAFQLPYRARRRTLWQPRGRRQRRERCPSAESSYPARIGVE